MLEFALKRQESKDSGRKEGKIKKSSDRESKIKIERKNKEKTT